MGAGAVLALNARKMIAVPNQRTAAVTPKITTMTTNGKSIGGLPPVQDSGPPAITVSHGGATF
jgi:hypothetical protein